MKKQSKPLKEILHQLWRTKSTVKNESLDPKTSSIGNSHGQPGSIHENPELLTTTVDNLPEQSVPFNGDHSRDIASYTEDVGGQLSSELAEHSKLVSSEAKCEARPMTDISQDIGIPQSLPSSDLWRVPATQYPNLLNTIKKNLTESHSKTCGTNVTSSTEIPEPETFTPERVISTSLGEQDVIRMAGRAWSVKFILRGTEYGPFPRRGSQTQSDTDAARWPSVLRESSDGEWHNIEAVGIGEQVYYRAITDILPNTELVLCHTTNVSPQIKPNLEQGNAENSEELSHVKLENNPKIHRCVKCGKSFARKVGLKSHMLVHSDAKPYRCEVCGKDFSRNIYLKTHMLTHSDLKPHECQECGKQFSRIGHLKSHKLSHSGERSFKCDLCGRTFIHRSDLNRHMIIHSGKKPHQCQECRKEFARQGDLKVHMFSHTGEKPQECFVCGKRFALKCSLKNHLLTHTGFKPFKCHLCAKGFTQNCHLKTHLLRHGGDKPLYGGE